MPTAITYTRFGGPEVLEVTKVDKPDPGPGQVRVQVRAAGVNPIDFKILRGLFGGEPPRQRRGIGVELAGVVDALGPDVDSLAIGDEVLGRATGGSWADYPLATVDNLVARPADLPWEVAGSMTIVAEAAARALNLTGVSTSDTVVINGASGGVGALATQLAVARGARVIGTASERNHDYLRAIGAIPVTYGAGMADRVRAVAPTIDAAVDTAGRGALPDLVELAGGTKRVITLADPDAAAHGVRFTGGGPGESVPLPDVFAEVLPLYRTGKLQFLIAQTYPLAQAAQALTASESGQAHGKLVLIP
ncbi:NADP-dependent oxidoreductase [Streptomyces sp. NPDC058612]|uniref:NADP-dependent oxidoreductase n=1 Tax=Streptomyces sp. NPDC058612 TaxID=3346555 RepID=UPI00366901B9